MAATNASTSTPPAAAGAPPELFVKTLTGRTVRLPFDPRMTVAGLKLQLQAELGIPPDQQRLCYAAHRLDDEQTLEQANISAEATVHMVLRLMMRETSGKAGFDVFQPPPS